jgi:hypothetical protein
MKRKVVLYIEDKDYKTLRSLLILQGQTVSAWIREKIKKYLDETKN